MTARLGSKYRYFGKLVLVPFRYFSIDIYRNIDIFDNTNVRHTHRFEAEGDTGVNSQVHMRPKAHPVCLKAQRFVVILSAHK